MRQLNLWGFNLIIHNHIPVLQKIKLSSDCPVSQAFREKFDAWLLERFGEKDEVIIIGQNGYVSPKVYAKIRNIGS